MKPANGNVLFFEPNLIRKKMNTTNVRDLVIFESNFKYHSEFKLSMTLQSTSKKHEETDT